MQCANLYNPLKNILDNPYTRVALGSADMEMLCEILLQYPKISITKSGSVYQIHKDEHFYVTPRDYDLLPKSVQPLFSQMPIQKRILRLPIE